MEDHERGLTDENQRLRHQLVVIHLDKDRCEAREPEYKKAVNDARMEIDNIK